ncbi:MAG: ATP-binding protein [Bacteroidota bacterium]
MKRFTPGFVVVLLVDVLLLVLCLLHLPSVSQRPRAPFETGMSVDGVRITRILDQSAAGDLRAGDRVLSWNTLPIDIPEAVEFLADMQSIGQKVSMKIERAGAANTVSIALIPFYSSPRFLIISSIVGIIIWLIGLFIHWSAQPDLTARVLHWAMMAFAVAILITPGAITKDTTSTIARILFFFSYIGVVALFFYFTLLYPTSKTRSRALAGVLTFLPAVVLAGLLNSLQILQIRTGSLENFYEFQILFDVFQVMLFAYVTGAVVCILMSFKTAGTAEERKRLEWIVWGLCIGSIPFLFLHVLPQLLISRYLIPEEYATIFFLAIPFSFSISFLRYHFLDIEVLINRSIVYALLSILGIIAFTLAFLLVTSAFETHALFEEYLVIAGVSLIMALLFAPARDRLQRIIDETLFAARANFQASLNSLSVRFHASLTTEELYKTLADGLSRVLPVRNLAVYELKGGGLQRRAESGSGTPSWIAFPLKHMGKGALWVTAGSVAAGIPANESMRGWLEDAGFSILLVLTDEAGRSIGAVGLNAKTRGDRFQREEIDLLMTAGAQASEVHARLQLQQRMFLEAEERMKLRELSELKSYFISSVSHELRMPLTSIRMFAETLRLGKVSGGRKKKEYLSIIEGESERLGRLIENVLNFSKIEKGIKEYKFEQVDVASIGKKAAAALRYDFDSVGGVLQVRVSRKLPALEADGEALQQVILNLLSNALKYSVGRTKRVRLAMMAKGGSVIIEVSDNGIGIAKEELPSIFEKFYRVRDDRSRQVGGTGLGLPLVRHVVEAHGGSIEVRSTVGKGTTFTVKIPVKR